MTPIYWLIGFAVFGFLFWRASKNNRKRARSRSHSDVAAKLAKENYRLRHVLAELSMDNHALRYTPPDYW